MLTCGRLQHCAQKDTVRFYSLDIIFYSFFYILQTHFNNIEKRAQSRRVDISTLWIVRALATQARGRDCDSDLNDVAATSTQRANAGRPPLC